MRRFRALLKKEFTHMRRDPRTIMVIFIMPILQLVLLGYATNTDVRNVPTVVFDQDNSRASRELLDAYKVTGYFSLDFVATSEDQVTTLIEGGRARVGIIIPPSYSSDLAANRIAEVAVLIDGSDPSIAQTALSAATLAGQAHGTTIRLQQLAARGAITSSASPIDVRTRVLYNPDLQSSYNMVPGLIAMILMQTTTNLTSASIVKERERGTIEQLIVTPIRPLELVIAKITPYVLVSLINVVVILVIGTVWFQVPIRGSFMLLFALTGLYLLPNLGIGLLISTIARTQQQAQFLVMPILLPSMMLSGFFFPIAALPAALQVVSQFLPLTYFLIIVRSVVIKGAGLELLMSQTIALTIFAVIFLGLAAMRFHKTLD
ncbi:MAG: ABC transporter permease [Chloroflexi bacterium]|nr:ABC transporter permease [Chloroflexota bacterium]